MPMIEALALVALGGCFATFAYLLASEYRAVLKREPRRVMSADAFLVMLFGAWSAPAVLAMVLFYLSVICIGIGGFMFFTAVIGI